MTTDDDLLKPCKPLTTLQRNLIRSSAAQFEDFTRNADSIIFQHSVFCQTSLPYRNPGDDVRTWDRRNGKAHLRISAGEALHPATEAFEPIGLPYGAKSRLILMHLNGEAIRTQSPVIEVEASLSAYVRRLKLASHGRNIRTIKDQLTRLSASRITLGTVEEGRALTVQSQIVTAFDLWMPKDDRQRVLWSSIIRLSEEYFGSLILHAVPMDETAIRALAHSALALDLYAWLAQRLHRIEPGKANFVAWAALKEQFGPDYERMDKFKAVLRHTLKMVWTQYQAARFDLDGRGMTLWHSHPPVKARIGIVSRKP